MLSLFLLRHGETEFSHQDRFCGRIDASLTPAGRLMAAQFAEAYGALDWQAVVTSTRLRAIESAAPLARGAGLEIEADARLDEMYYGAWQGLSKSEAAAHDADYFARWQSDPSIGPPLGEPPHAVAARAVAAIADLCVRHPEGKVLVVSHKALLRILLCELFGTGLEDYRRGPGWPVGAVTQIDLGGRGPLLRLLADVAHLGPRRPDDDDGDDNDRWAPPLRAVTA